MCLTLQYDGNFGLNQDSATVFKSFKKVPIFQPGGRM
jgi:hypothetical protein